MKIDKIYLETVEGERDDVRDINSQVVSDIMTHILKETASI